jgi:hypothetical protein
MEAIEEYGQDSSFSGRRGREYALQSEVVGGLSDLLALGGIVGAHLGVAELQGRAGSGVTEVEKTGKGDLVAIQTSRQEVHWIAPLPFGETVELANGRLTVEREIESGEAIRRIPPPAVDSSAYT